MQAKQEIATLGGGCFWCLEAVYLRFKGVERVESGYAGGVVPNPSYEEVCTGTTGHAEVVQVTFDPGVISYRELLEVFFSIHDPTTLNRQGADVGTQYRSVIFYHTDDQKAVAEEMIRMVDESGTWRNPVVTELKPIDVFYKAEAYHQDYYARNANQPYCRVVISPKLKKLEKEQVDKLRLR
jgi:peptide-methionine (S)-S-oxide reductase